MWLTFLISWLPVKNIIFDTLGGPHPVEKLRASWSFSAEEILPQASRHQPLVSSLLACCTDFRLDRLHNHESQFLKISPYLSIYDVSMYLESPLDCKEMKPINPKGNQPWIFIGRTDAETPILWPSDAEPTHWKRPWCWEILRAGGEGDNRGWDGIISSVDVSLSQLPETVKDRGAWRAAVHGAARDRHKWAAGQQSMYLSIRCP